MVRKPAGPKHTGPKCEEQPRFSVVCPRTHTSTQMNVIYFVLHGVPQRSRWWDPQARRQGPVPGRPAHTSTARRPCPRAPGRTADCPTRSLGSAASEESTQVSLVRTRLPLTCSLLSGSLSEPELGAARWVAPGPHLHVSPTRSWAGSFSLPLEERGSSHSGCREADPVAHACYLFLTRNTCIPERWSV